MISLAAKAALFCFSLTLSSPSTAASDQEVMEMKRAIDALMVKNQELSKRLSAIEENKAPPARQESPAGSERSAVRDTIPAVRGRRSRAAVPPDEPKSPAPAVQVETPPTGKEALEQRVKELELAKTAQESAVRTIIGDTFSKAGSKINQFVTLGGAIEVLAGRSTDFAGVSRDKIVLNTAELDLEIRLTDWMLGTFVASYDDGTSVLFPANNGRNVGIDRISVDRAHMFIGDVQRFPIYLKAGRDVLPFGTSTGVHRSDVLSIDSPLTTEIFETKVNSVGIGFAFPTPKLGPPPTPYIAPSVKPLVIEPLLTKVAKYMGYVPVPIRPKRPSPTTAPPEPPAFYGSLYTYDANLVEGVNRRLSGSLSGRLGYHTRGHCGRSYEELVDSLVCPWAFDGSVDYIGSVFDSKFLREGYSAIIPQIGRAPGMAINLKASLGPLLLVGEWNSAIKRAGFLDDTGRRIFLSPGAWQASLGYQFDWNPWVETIGSNGDYFALGYSQSTGMAGVSQIGGSLTRVGSAPEKRLTVTAGEWVFDGAKVAVEYSHVWDYSTVKGGTGREANGVFTTMTLAW